MWSFNFFFYNRKLKRILYFACRGKTHAAASSSGEESSECAYNSDAEVKFRPQYTQISLLFESCMQPERNRVRQKQDAEWLTRVLELYLQCRSSKHC